MIPCPPAQPPCLSPLSTITATSSRATHVPIKVPFFSVNFHYLNTHGPYRHLLPPIYFHGEIGGPRYTHLGTPS